MRPTRRSMLNRSMLAISAAAFAAFSGVARAEASYLCASEVTRCTRIESRDVPYPANARRAMQSGAVTVGGVVRPDGMVLDVTLLESSGHAELDAVVTAAFMRIHCSADEGASPICMKEKITFSLM
ncbi:TonB family protein [Burkholderia contaminans]|uniref:TonB family protein n=2 Tax=Burkholderia contaminans TaxID=488447 RepID=UPI000F592117|nr:TonB family protein [Burkholderia contaminans]MCA8153661.1 energy transducer TonB [Burkholderia contaminans]RQT16651.1 TonB family protein [Burkholderia contaminans]